MRRGQIISDLLRRANLTAPDLLAADVAAALVDAGGDHLVIYVVDYEQQTLRPIGVAQELQDLDDASVAVTGSMAGQAYQRQEVLSAKTEDGWRVWAPIRERAEQIGVLEAGFGGVDDETLALCEDLGRLIGHLIRTADRYTDLIEMRRRRSHMSLPAEMQWDMLLPPLAFRCPELAVAGLLEPAYDVGGDGFDYSLNHETFAFVFFDAMGHSLRSSLASALALAAYRHARRRGLGLAETAHQIDQTLISQFDGEVFVTAQLGQVDIATGAITWVNAGHPDPLLLRGTTVVAELHAEPCLPLGLGIRLSEVGDRHLEPGDRLLFYSDGVIEARPKGGEQFGRARLSELFERHVSDQLLAAETLRRIVVEVLSHRADRLQDDASLMLVEWQPQP